MKIETQAQADAAQKFHDSAEIERLSGLLEDDDFNRLTRIVLSLRAALAAWNERKEIEGIVLGEDALVMLRYFELYDDNGNRWNNAHYQLKKCGLIDNRREPTPKGRAYLAAHKPRELRWEIHRTGVDDSLRAAVNYKCDAVGILEYLERINGVKYQLREVKP